VLRDYLKNFKNDFGEAAQRGVLNCLRIIDYAHDGDMSGEDFSELDLRLYSFLNKNCCDANFSNSYITRESFFSQGHEAGICCAKYSPDGSYIATACCGGFIKLWRSDAGKLLRTFIGHTKAVLYVDFHPDGSRIVSASRDGTMKIWDVETAKLICSIESYREEEPNLYENARYSKNGKQIITLVNNIIAVWDAENYVLVREIIGASDTDWTGIRIAGSSHDGNTILSVSSDNIIKIWDVYTGELLNEIDFFANEESYVPLITAKYSPDDKFILTTTLGGAEVGILDSSIGEMVEVLRCNDHISYDALYSQDGKHIITTDLDGVNIWDGKSFDYIRSFKANISYSPRHSTIVSPDGQNILCITAENCIGIWDFNSGKLVRSFGGEDGRYGVRYTPDGTHVLFTSSTHKSIKVYDSRFYTLLYEINGAFADSSYFDISPNGDFICSVFTDVINIYTYPKGRFIRGINAPNVSRAVYSPNGKFILSTASNNYHCDPYITIWDSNSGELVRVINGELNHEAGSADRTKSANFSPNGKYIVSSSYKSYHSEDLSKWESCIYQLNVWDIDSGNLVRTIEESDYKSSYRPIYRPIYSPNGKYIASVYETNHYDDERGLQTIKIWNSETGEIARILDEPEDVWFCFDIRFSADGKYLFSHYHNRGGDGSNYSIVMWNIETGECANRIEGRKIQAFDLSPDNQHLILVSKDKIIRVYNTSSCDLERTIHPLPNISLYGANFGNIISDDITEQDMLLLKENGAIVS
jgi:WD40 repeat protein